MLIATSLTVIALASALAGAAAPVTTVPPIAIRVSAPDVSPTLVPRVLAEAEAIWRAAGFTLLWRIDRKAAAQPIDAPPCYVSSLHVVIGAGRAADAGRRQATSVALGWIVFDNDSPESEIYLSLDNADVYMTTSRAVIGLVDRMPIAERETLLGRAMGRALAHELGHYLLASKFHTGRGLMQATHTATDFFSFERRAFVVDPAQRQAIVARLQQDRALAVLRDDK
jgi:hypothetical protein